MPESLPVHQIASLMSYAGGGLVMWVGGIVGLFLVVEQLYKHRCVSVLLSVCHRFLTVDLLQTLIVIIDMDCIHQISLDISNKEIKQ